MFEDDEASTSLIHGPVINARHDVLTTANQESRKAGNGSTRGEYPPCCFLFLPSCFPDWFLEGPPDSVA
jgi:hypothetical protein